MSRPGERTLTLKRELLQPEEAEKAARYAGNGGGRVYTWHTIGTENWLQAGVGLCDVLCLLVLPDGLPDTIAMPDDEADEPTASLLP